jgi:hypothetical protein
MLSLPRRPDIFLLFSLLLVILLHPVLDHGGYRRTLLGITMLLPVILATVRLSEAKGWKWLVVLLLIGAVALTAADIVLPGRAFATTKFGLLAAFFALTVSRMFFSLKNARSVDEAHLATAVSIYLLLGMLWFALYSAIEALHPGAILFTHTRTDRQSELLYFSLVTLSTVGYGDILPIQGEVRMLAALEGITGVLYVAIIVAMLVGAYQRKSNSN